MCIFVVVVVFVSLFFTLCVIHIAKHMKYKLILESFFLQLNYHYITCVCVCRCGMCVREKDVSDTEVKLQEVRASVTQLQQERTELISKVCMYIACELHVCVWGGGGE